MKIYQLIIAMVLVACSGQKTDEDYLRFNHVMLYVADLDRSIDFYTSAFPLKVRDRIDTLTVRAGEEASTRAVRMATLTFPGQDFVLEMAESAALPDSLANTGSYQHLGVNVPDIGQAYQRLLEAGAKEVSPVREVSANTIVAMNAFFEGPDGELIELMQVTKGYF